MIIKGETTYKDQIKKVLNKMQGINKWQYDFMFEIFELFVSIKGRLNFFQLSRYGKHREQRYRNQFNKSFDFLTFNNELTMEHGSGHFTIAFDPSYLSKSGKATPGTGYFWSGVAGKTKWGLEISGIGVIDIDNHTGFHLEAVQTPINLGSKNLLEHYANILIERKQPLLSISKYLVVDAYFSKKGFVFKLTENGFEIVSRLRDDADLKYKYNGEQKPGKGRPKQYDGKIFYDNLKEEYFKTIEQNQNTKIYQGIVYSKSLKRDINLVIVYTNKKGKWTHKLYFSTDLNLSAEMVLKYYRTRFQIEFIFRDAKQHTGLNHCQARNENKLHFHFNTSLTTINLAKVTHWLSIPKNQRGAFSMVNIKTMYHNELLLNRFFSVFGIRPNLSKNKEKFQELLLYRARAA